MKTTYRRQALLLVIGLLTLLVTASTGVFHGGSAVDGQHLYKPREYYLKTLGWDNSDYETWFKYGERYPDYRTMTLDEYTQRELDWCSRGYEIGLITCW